MDEPLQDNVVILQYSGIFRRFFASIIDGIIVGLGISLLSFGTVMLLAFSGVGMAIAASLTTLIGLALTIVFPWIYMARLESSSYQASLGKLLVGVRVTDLEGRKVTFLRASGRHFAKIVSGILLIGYLMAFFTQKKQALHDLMAGCLVIRKIP